MSMSNTSMDDLDFFDTLENKLEVTISQRIKSHLKFHNMDNFKVASLMTEQDIIEIENFARNTLHQVLQPEEMVEFYGCHFQKKPELFVFTLGERMQLSGIKQVCQEVCHIDLYNPEENDTYCDFPTSTDKFTNIEQYSDDSETQTNGNKTQQQGETNAKPCMKNKIKQIPVQATSVKQEMETTTMIWLKNLDTKTSDVELIELAKPFGPIRWHFLSKDKNSGLCNGCGGVDFKFRDHAALAMEFLNGYKYKNKILSVDWWSPSCKKREANSNK